MSSENPDSIFDCRSVLQRTGKRSAVVHEADRSDGLRSANRTNWCLWTTAAATRLFKVLSDIYEHDRRVNLVRLRRNFGQTAALKAGFDFARGEIIISMDGDLQHDPERFRGSWRKSKKATTW